MLPMPAMNFWSISSGLELHLRGAEQLGRTSVHDIGVLDRVEAEVGELGDLLGRARRAS